MLATAALLLGIFLLPAREGEVPGVDEDPSAPEERTDPV